MLAGASNQDWDCENYCGPSCPALECRKYLHSQTSWAQVTFIFYATDFIWNLTSDVIHKFWGVLMVWTSKENETCHLHLTFGIMYRLDCLMLDWHVDCRVEFNQWLIPSLHRRCPSRQRRWAPTVRAASSPAEEKRRSGVPYQHDATRVIPWCWHLELHTSIFMDNVLFGINSFAFELQNCRVIWIT